MVVSPTQDRHRIGGISHPALSSAIESLRSRPSRTWSLIITFYGDAVVPRGGSLWLGTLLQLFEALGVTSGVVRTSMSRLAADGWLQRNRIGRNSFYRLTETGRETFAVASDHIYNPRLPVWDGNFIMLVEDGAAGRDDMQSRLAARGFGNLAAGVWIAPHEAGSAAEQNGLMLKARPMGDARRLAAIAWPLDKVATLYEQFLAAFAPLAEALSGVGEPDPEFAIKARLLLIHEFRRVILRDPLLPDELLPPSWPGRRARDACKAIYPKLLPASECWLDTFGQCEDGALPKAEQSLFSRFQS